MDPLTPNYSFQDDIATQAQHLVSLSDLDIDLTDPQEKGQLLKIARHLVWLSYFRPSDTCEGDECFSSSQTICDGSANSMMKDTEMTPGGSTDESTLQSSTEEERHPFEDIAGLDDVKESLQNMLVLPRYLPYLFKGLLSPPKRLLLYGLPGNGKSCLVRAAARASGIRLLTVSPSDIMSSWVGGSEQALNDVFKNAVDNAPTLLFFDEIDSFMRARTQREDDTTRRLKCEMLHQLDKLELEGTDVVIVAATNRPFDLDAAVLRRFQQTLFVPPPEEQAKFRLFKTFLSDHEQCALADEDYKVLARDCGRRSCSDIRNVCMNALMRPITELQRAKHFKICNDEKGNQFLQPCKPSDAGAVRISLFNVAMTIKPRKVTFKDVLTELQAHRESYTDEDLNSYKNWTVKE